MTGSPRLSKGAWLRAFGRTVHELFGDNLMDRAASLTYYGILAIFPGLLVLVATVGYLGGPAIRSLMEGFGDMTFGPTQQVLAEGTANLANNRRQAGIAAITGLVVAFWSATGYVGAYMRAANSIHEVNEERPLWKLVPLRIFVTVVTGAVLAVSAFAIVFSGRLAVRVGAAFGWEEGRIKAFDVVKWPLLVLVFLLLLAMLYWVSPHGRGAGFRWITQGSVLATVVWLLGSTGFAVYVSWFNSFNRTYGTLGGVIIFLVWMWLTNVAVLLGADFDAELQMARARLAASTSAGSAGSAGSPASPGSAGGRRVSLPQKLDDASVGAGTPAGPVHTGDRVEA
ncbi:MAG TPA: YihY/virulence factor BrkB family protein [Candidatus Limnocylindrales bacterium]